MGIFIPLNMMDFNKDMDNAFLLSIHTVKDLRNDVNEIFSGIELVHHKKARKEYDLYNVSCAFDIETTSTHIEDEKFAFMYVWQMMLNGYIIMGRTWKELEECFQILADELDLSDYKRLPIYVHNLGYEFQFLRKYFKITDFFATDKRTPVHLVVNEGIELRDSLILSGYSLANLNKAMIAKVYKKEGDLDYEKIRHCFTPLTDEEKLYCIYDVYVLSVYIYEKISNGENVDKIPYTKTGYVRNLIRKKCLKVYSYRNLMKKLTIEPWEYTQLKATYQGGFTHANTILADETHGDKYNLIASKDFTSSYPTVLISEKYPMRKGRKLELKEEEKIGDTALQLLERLTEKYCYSVEILIEGLKQKTKQEAYISKSKTTLCEDAQVENGRISNAEAISMFVTDVDINIIKVAYSWDNIYIDNLVIYRKGYLPKQLVETILILYQKKTALKDVPGCELEYQKAKEMLNSIYGMMCQDPLQDINEYVDNEWTFEKVDMKEGIDKYNESRSRATYYPWGVWCCAYARRNLWLGGIVPLGMDYIYSDTDSVKYRNPENHEEIFEEYNKEITRKLKKACEWHGIDFEMTRPKTVEGVSKPLGVWDDDGYYEKFKTLGAKRYLVKTVDGEIKPTIAGMPKKYAKKFFEKQEDPFETFSAGDKKHPLKISKDETGKSVLTYIDDERGGYVKDYLGNIQYMTAETSIYMEKTSFSLSLSSEFLRILNGVKTKKII